jgi:hypothetical protein
MNERYENCDLEDDDLIPDSDDLFMYPERDVDDFTTTTLPPPLLGGTTRRRAKTEDSFRTNDQEYGVDEADLVKSDGGTSSSHNVPQHAMIVY